MASKLHTVCSKCGGPKKFRVRKDRTNKESYCSPCRAKRTQRYYAENPDARKAYREKAGKEKLKDQQLRTIFDISLEMYNIMLINQNDSCATCYRHKSIFNKALVVDHDHKTGKIRGLLCSDCNLSLGMVKDNVATLFNLGNYLEKSLRTA